MPWIIDSSTFINSVVIGKVDLLVYIRVPSLFPEYVFRFELGTSAQEYTRASAARLVKEKKVSVCSLTLEDLDKLAELNAPRRISVGELACALVAQRMGGGVLCDDWKARKWLEEKMPGLSWDSIEGFLLDAASRGYMSEFELSEAQDFLRQNRYHCRFDLRIEHLRRQANQ